MSESTSNQNHPHGFDFDYDFWFECDCSARTQVSASIYEQQCNGERPHPHCASCDTTIDIARANPAVRDPSDIDHQDEAVDRHYWYHSTYLEDWPSEDSYRQDVTEMIEKSMLPHWQHQGMIDGKLSIALHLGTYGAAVENILRRRCNQDFDGRSYWLHQVEIRLEAADLYPAVRRELDGVIGDVPLSELVKHENSQAVRYVNTHESAGSISLAVARTVIARVRTIALPPPSTVLSASARAQKAVEAASAQLADAQRLRPDTTGIPDNKIPRSVHAVKLAERRGIIDPRLMEVAKKTENYENRHQEIWTELKNGLLDEYLVGVNAQVRSLFDGACQTVGNPHEFHEQVKGLAVLVCEPDSVVRAFEDAKWRKIGHVP
ncbi:MULTISPECIES: hypothetical protein [Nocardiaceae]|uniref:hypothetical protein n=1 Tax=Nocardiaceae TaxID=85025 RepID=UPI0011401806|nr:MULTISPECIES: hypothetical protein [Rhodococcus]